MPCLPRPRRYGLLLRTGAKGFAQDDELRGFPRSGRQRSQECQRVAAECHAGIRRQSERRLLLGRPLRLSACPLLRRGGAGAAGETRRQASCRPAGGGFLHGQAMSIRNVLTMAGVRVTICSYGTLKSESGV